MEVEKLGLVGDQQQGVSAQTRDGQDYCNQRSSSINNAEAASSLLDCLKLVAKVDLSSQDLEQDNHLLIWQLTVLCDQSKNRHRSKLAPVQTCTTALTVRTDLYGRR